jgi:hypothetical protein
MIEHSKTGDSCDVVANKSFSEEVEPWSERLPVYAYLRF